MNGRCSTDPLDRAEDICEACGEQFCGACLLYPRGRKQPPTCKGCALANSGLRGSSGPNKGITKREWKKRRKELEEDLTTVVLEQPAVDYFQLEAEDPGKQANRTSRTPVPEEPQLPESAPTGLLAEVRLAPPPVEEPAPPTPTPPPVPATPRFEAPADLPTADISVNPLALESEPSPLPPPTPPVAAPLPVVSAVPMPPSATAPSAIPPSAAAPSFAPPSATETAAELLAKLKANEPIRSQYQPVVNTPDLDEDPFGAPPVSGASVDPFASTPAVHQAAAPAQALAPELHDRRPTDSQPDDGRPIDADPFASRPATEVEAPVAPTAPAAPTAPIAPAPQTGINWSGSTPAPTPLQDPMSSTRARATAAPTPPWSPPVPPPRGTSLDDAGPSPEREIPSPPSRGQTPRPTAPSVPPPAAESTRSLLFNQAGSQRPAPALPPSGPTSAVATAEVPAQSADVDANGNWIPPNLRGMAAPGPGNSDDLPRRRRGE